MKLVKALTELKMARSGAEANRLVKQGSVWIGGCTPPCNARVFPFKCTCNGWHKATSPTEDVPVGQVIRIKDGSWRLLTRMDGSQGFDQVPGINRVPNETTITFVKESLFSSDAIQITFWKAIFFIRDKFRKTKEIFFG
jgi:hypothetical protein